MSTTLLEMHFFSGAQHSFILIRRSPKTSDSWFLCFWKISFFSGLFSVYSRQKVVSCLQEISKGQKLCHVSLEGLWPHSCTTYRWFIVHHVLHLCCSMALMSRAQGSVLPCLKTAAREALPVHLCPSAESEAIAAVWAKLVSGRGGW